MRSQSYLGYRSDCLGCPGRDKLSEKTCVEAVSGKSPRNGICAAQMASDCQEKYHGLNFDDIGCPSVRIASSMRCEKANIESISSVSKECSDKLKYECQRVNPCFQTCLEKNTHDRKACRFFAYNDKLSATPNCKYFYNKNSSEFKCKEWEIFRLTCPGYENNLEPCFGEPSSLVSGIFVAWKNACNTFKQQSIFCKRLGICACCSTMCVLHTGQWLHSPSSRRRRGLLRGSLFLRSSRLLFL